VNTNIESLRLVSIYRGTPIVNNPADRENFYEQLGKQHRIIQVPREFYLDFRKVVRLYLYFTNRRGLRTTV